MWAVYHDHGAALAEAARVEAEFDRISRLWMNNRPEYALKARQGLEAQYGKGSLDGMYRADVVVVNGV